MKQRKLLTAPQIIGVLTALFCAFLGFIEHPPLLGGWEGSSLFHIFAPEKISLDLRINPRANIGGHGYAALDIARYFANALDLSFWGARLVPVLWGFVSLLLIFVVTRKWFGAVAALCATLLLAVNQCFLIYQHELLVLMPTMAALLFVLWRFQRIDESPTKKNAALFGFAGALMGLLYGPGRLLSVLIWLFWLCWPSRKSTILKTRAALALISFAVFALTFVILDQRNLYYFKFPLHFLSPPDSEHARGLGQIISFFRLNLPLVFGAFFGDSQHFNGRSSDLIVDIRSPIVSIPTLLLFLAGLAASLRSVFKKHVLFLLFFLSAAALTPALSEVVMVKGEPVFTFSICRLFFVLAPVHIFAGLGAVKIYELAKRSIWTKRLAIAAGVAVLSWQTAAYFAEIRRFNRFTENYSCGFVDAGARKGEYVCGRVPEVKTDFIHVDEYFNKYGEHTLYNEHIAFYRFAKILSDKARDKASESSEVIIIDAPVWIIDPQAYIGQYLRHNHFQIFLKYYLSLFEVNAAFVQFFSSDSSPQMPGFWSTVTHISPEKMLKYFGITRKFPLEIDSERKAYKPKPGNQQEYGVIRSFKPGSTRYVLVTTDRERQFAEAKLKELGLSFSVLR